MIDVEKLVEQLDCICYRNFAIVKVFSPYFMTIAKSVDVNFLRNVVHIDEECFVLILKRGCDIVKVRDFFEKCNSLVNDVQII